MVDRKKISEAADKHAWPGLAADLTAEEAEKTRIKFMSFKEGANWALEQQRWIPVTEKWPERGQSVNFIVDLPGNIRHGSVYGGHFTGDRHGFPIENEFSTPGWGCPASHWMSSPEPPKP